VSSVKIFAGERSTIQSCRMHCRISWLVATPPSVWGGASTSQASNWLTVSPFSSQMSIFAGGCKHAQHLETSKSFGAFLVPSLVGEQHIKWRDWDEQSDNRSSPKWDPRVRGNRSSVVVPDATGCHEKTMKKVCICYLLVLVQNLILFRQPQQRSGVDPGWAH